MRLANSLREGLKILFRMLDHEVKIQGSAALEPRHSGGTKRDIGHKVAVHDVNVDHVAIRLNGSDFGVQIAEVSGEDGRGDEERHRRMFKFE